MVPIIIALRSLAFCNIISYDEEELLLLLLLLVEALIDTIWFDRLVITFMKNRYMIYNDDSDDNSDDDNADTDGVDIDDD